MEEIDNKTEEQPVKEVKQEAEEAKEVKKVVNKVDLPNATTVLVLGILSLVFCWCYGFIGLILGIIAVVLSGSPRKAYMTDQSLYTETSFKNLNAGRICGIVGICLSSLIVVFWVLFILGVATLALTGAACNL